MILFLLGCATDPVLGLEGDAARGAATWEAECGLCHGQAGEGTPRGGPLQGVFERRTEDEILGAIRFGVSTMPAYEGALTEQELADLLAWMEQNL